VARSSREQVKGREPDQGDPCRDHYLEPGAPRQVRDVIARHADEMQKKRGVVGSGGPDCLSTQNDWADVFESESIEAYRLGRTLDRGRGQELGGFRVPGEANPRDHHWLAVGPHFTLFDPTWGQFFREFGPPSLDRYVTDDGRPFPMWRHDELQRHHSAGEG